MEQCSGLIEQIRAEPNETVQLELFSKLINIINNLGINEFSKGPFTEVFYIFEIGEANDFPTLKTKALNYVNSSILSFFSYLSPEREAWFGTMCNFLVRNTSNIRLKVKTISFFNKILTPVLFYTVSKANSSNKDAFVDFIQNKFWKIKGEILGYFFNKGLPVDIRISSLKFAEMCLFCFTQQEGARDFNLDSFSNMTACEIIPKTLLQKDMEELIGSLLGRLDDNIEGTTVILSLLDTFTEVATHRIRLCGQILSRIFNFAHTATFANITPAMHPSLWYGLRRSLDSIASLAKTNNLVNERDLKSIKDLATSIAGREQTAKRAGTMSIPEPPMRRTSPPPMPQAIPLQYPQFHPAISSFPQPPPLPLPPPPPLPPLQIIECKRLDELFPQIGDVRKDDVINVALEALLKGNTSAARYVPHSKICDGVCDGLKEYIAEMKKYRKSFVEMSDEQKRAQSISAEKRLIMSQGMAETASALGIHQEFMARTADIDNAKKDPIVGYIMNRMRDISVPDQEKYGMALSLLYKIAINTDLCSDKDDEQEEGKEGVVKLEEAEEGGASDIYKDTFMEFVHSVGNSIPIVKSAPWIPEEFINELNDVALRTGDVRSLEVQEAIFMDNKAYKDVCFNNLLSYTTSQNDILRGRAIKIVCEHLHILGDPITSRIEDYAISSVLSHSSTPAMTSSSSAQVELYYELCGQSRKIVEPLFNVYAAADDNVKKYIINNMPAFVHMIKNQRFGTQLMHTLLKNPIEGAYDIAITLLQTLIRCGSNEEVDALHEIARSINGIPTDPPPLYYLAARLTEEEAQGLVLHMAQHSSVADYTQLFRETRMNMLSYCLTLPDLGIPLDATRNIVTCCFNARMMNSEDKTRLFNDLIKTNPMPVLTTFVVYLILCRNRGESNWINEYILPHIVENIPWDNIVMSTDLANCCILMGKLGLKWLEKIPKETYKMFPPESKDKLLQYVRENENSQQLLNLIS